MDPFIAYMIAASGIPRIDFGVVSQPYQHLHKLALTLNQKTETQNYRVVKVRLEIIEEETK